MHKITPKLSLEYNEKGKALQCIRLCFNFDENQQILFPSKKELHCASLKKYDNQDDKMIEPSVLYNFFTKDDQKDDQLLLHKASFMLSYNDQNASYNQNYNELMKIYFSSLLECIFDSGHLFDVHEMQTQAKSLIETITPEWIDAVNKRLMNSNKQPITAKTLSDDISKAVEQICTLSQEKHKQNNPLNLLEDAKIEAIASNLIKS